MPFAVVHKGVSVAGQIVRSAEGLPWGWSMALRPPAPALCASLSHILNFLYFRMECAATEEMTPPYNNRGIYLDFPSLSRGLSTIRAPSVQAAAQLIQA